MSNLRAPIPMLSPLGWGSSTDSGLPDNLYVLAELESFTGDIKALDSYKAASLFSNSKEVSLARSTDRRWSLPVSLERILNWSFIVGRKSIFDWRSEDILSYLEFRKVPDISWISSATHSRFLREQSIPYKELPINKGWRPYSRKINDGLALPLEWDLRRSNKERKAVLDFFEFIASKTSYSLSYLAIDALKELRCAAPKLPSRAAQRAHSNGLTKLYSHELDWVFGKAAGLRETHWYYNVVLFAMAIMRYTDIPIKALCRGYGRVGTLSQFERGDDNVWRFTDKPDVASEKIYELDQQMDVYLKWHAGYLGVPYKRKFPDIEIFTRPDNDQGFGYYHLKALMERFRAEICQLIENCDDPIIFASKFVLSSVLSG